VVFVFVLTGIAILGAVALVASGSGDGLEPVATDRPGPWVPPDRAVSGDDVRQVRFAVAFRGYRMAEVDQLLDRLAGEIALRDELIDELESQAGGPVPVHPQPTEPRTDV
jgi:DivIVA domain-containing protein